MENNVLKIGSRSTPLAIAQTQLVLQLLQAVHKGNPFVQNAEIIKIKTTGDKIQDKSLADFGGKALFTKEIDRALLDGEINCAVHSLKDLESDLPDGIQLVATPVREDTSEVLIANAITSVDELPQGATFGTCAPRREALILNMRPDLKVVPLRGSIQTRMQKVVDGEVDATLLAAAGLRRMGIDFSGRQTLNAPKFIPAVGQGALALTARANDPETVGLIKPLNDDKTMACTTAERAMLKHLGGTCRTAIGGLCTLIDDEYELHGVYAPEGGEIRFANDRGKDPHKLGVRVAEKLLDR